MTDQNDSSNMESENVRVDADSNMEGDVRVEVFEPLQCADCVNLRNTVKQCDRQIEALSRENRDLYKCIDRARDILELLYQLCGDGQNLSLRLRSLSDKMRRTIHDL